MSPFKTRTPYTLAEACKMGLLDAEKRISSARSYKSASAHLRGYFGDERPLSSITPEELEEFQLHSLETYSGNTTRQRFAFLSRCYKVAIGAGHVKTNPVKNVDIIPVPEGRRVFVHPEQIPALFSALSVQDRFITLVFLHSGLRRSEVYRLSKSDVDLQHGFFSVLGKGNKQREVEIHEDLPPILSHLMEKSEDHWLIPGAANRDNAAARYRTRFRQACHKVGLDVRVHDLRRSFASWILEFSEDADTMMALKELLGHTSLKTTEVYTRSSSRRRRKAVNAVPLAGVGLKALGLPGLAATPGRTIKVRRMF